MNTDPVSSSLGKLWRFFAIYAVSQEIFSHLKIFLLFFILKRKYRYKVKIYLTISLVLEILSEITTEKWIYKHGY